MSAPVRQSERGPLPVTRYEGTLEGELLLDRLSGEVIDFKMMAEGMARGRSTYTPGPPSGDFPLKIAFILATDVAARDIPPQGMNYRLRGYLNPALPPEADLR